MTAVVGPKLACYATLAAGCLFLGLVLHRPEIVVVGVPAAIALVVGLRVVPRPSLVVEAAVAADRVLEGDDIDLEWLIRADRALGRVDLVPALPAGIGPAPGQPRYVTAVLDGPGPCRVRQRLVAQRWGRWSIERLAWRVADPGRLVAYEDTAEVMLTVRVHPRPERLRGIVEPVHTAIANGAHASRRAAEGIEFAEVGPMAPGEQLRSINWRATARHHGDPWVNRQHPERVSDVVLLVDTGTEEALVGAVRVAMILATAYAAQRDRIGVVGFGGMLRWVRPGTGLRHLYRVLDALLLTETTFSYLWRDPAVLPARTLPAAALVWALSPLDDPRAFATVRNLRSRGVDLAVVEIETSERARPGPRPTDQLAHRLWTLQRQAQRRELRGLGVPVVEWHDATAVEAVLDTVNAFRRAHRRRPA